MSVEVRPAIATVSLGRAEAGHDILGKIRQASLAGFHGVEIFFECLEQFARTTFDATNGNYEHGLMAAAAQVAQCCIDHRVHIVCLQPFLYYDGLVDAKEHAARLATLRLWFKLCHTLGTTLIQIPTNFKPHGTTGDRKRLVADLREAASMGLAETPVIRLAYEGISWGNHVDTWEDTWQIVKEVNLPNLGLCLDTFHIAGRVWADPTVTSGRAQGGDEALRSSLRRLITELDMSKIFYLQISDAERLQPPMRPSNEMYVAGQPPRMTWSRSARLFACEETRGGYLPILQICRTILVDVGWKGWASFEVFGHNTDPHVPHEMAQRGARSWRNIASQLGFSEPGILRKNTGQAVIAPLRHQDGQQAPDSTSKVVFLIGTPISHSLSPVFNNSLWEHLNLRQRYVRLQTSDIKDGIAALRSKICVGGAVTMPHKGSILPYLDEISEEARVIGAVNTVVVRCNPQSDAYSLYGANLDCIGIRDVLRAAGAKPGHEQNGDAGLIIGGGATARTAVYALWRYFHFRQFYVIKRNRAEVDHLATHFVDGPVQVEIYHLDSAATATKISPQPVLAIAAVPDIDPDTDGELHAREAAFTVLRAQPQNGNSVRLFLDMCYYPDVQTTLLRAAGAAGWKTTSGIEVLMAINWAQNTEWLARPMDQFYSTQVDEKIRRKVGLWKSE